MLIRMLMLYFITITAISIGQVIKEKRLESGKNKELLGYNKIIKEK